MLRPRPADRDSRLATPAPITPRNNWVRRAGSRGARRRGYERAGALRDMPPLGAVHADDPVPTMRMIAPPRRSRARSVVPPDDDPGRDMEVIARSRRGRRGRGRSRPCLLRVVRAVSDRERPLEIPGRSGTASRRARRRRPKIRYRITMSRLRARSAEERGDQGGEDDLGDTHASARRLPAPASRHR